MEIERSEKLAYWIGIVQSDGSFTKNVKSDKGPSEISMGVGRKSVPMLDAFRGLSGEIFDRHSGRWKIKGKDEWRAHICVKRHIENFKNLDIKFHKFFPPDWCTESRGLFGSYLAGLIDGDGDVRVKRPKYPQCVIRLTSGEKQDFLGAQISRILGCAVQHTDFHKNRYQASFGRFVKSDYNTLEFYVSKKNTRFLERFVLPNMRLNYKRRLVEKFIKKRKKRREVR